MKDRVWENGCTFTFAPSATNSSLLCILTPTLVRLSVVKKGGAGVPRDIQAEFAELEVVWREQVLRDFPSGLWFWELRKNLFRYSPKMKCWLLRCCFDELADLLWRDAKMPRGNGQEERKEKLGEWGFVNVTLSEDEQVAAKQDFGDPDTLWERLVMALTDGYKLTLSYDAESESYCAAYSGTNCGKPNEKLVLTAWGATETDALIYLAYKHEVKLLFVWNKPGNKARRLG